MFQSIRVQPVFAFALAMCVVGLSVSIAVSQPAQELVEGGDGAVPSVLDGIDANTDASTCGSVGMTLAEVQVSSEDDLSNQVPGPRMSRGPQQQGVTAIALDASEDWVEVATVTTTQMLAPGARYTVRFDRDAEILRDFQPDDGLTDAAGQAVDRAPTWLQDQLRDNLRRMDDDDQDTLAGLVLSAEDPIVDEVAFQVARVAPESLTHQLFTPRLVVGNAESVYEYDAVLQYVNVVDYGSAGQGGDYYSTTAYRYAADDGTTSWVEIPRDVYYWWVVHPKLSDETVKESSESSDRQATYGHFWREYLWLNPNAAYSYAAGNEWAESYPILGDVMKRPTVFWDGVRHNSLPKGRPFTDDDTALDTIGNWVSKVLPKKAVGNRPVQPNQIAYEHNGNCGEIQDLLGAAARTGLAPVLLTSNPCEDHVWNEFFWQTEDASWHPYQVSWDGGPTHIDNPSVAMDKDHGGGKDLSGVWAWRGDGYIFDVVERYSNTASLEIQVVDASEVPIDGARVLLFSEAWGDQGFTIAGVGFTSHDGMVSFTFGENQDYYVRVETSVGSFPVEENRITRVISESKVGEEYRRLVSITDGSIPQRQHTVSEVEGSRYKLKMNVMVPQEIVHGHNPFGEGAEFAKWENTGSVAAYALDRGAHTYLSFGRPFEASMSVTSIVSDTIEAAVPDMGDDWYIVLANELQANGVVVEAEVTLLRNEAYEPPVVLLPWVGRNTVAGAASLE